jgi:hypothetical protein
MLGLDEVLRDVGVDASGLQQLGIQTGPRLMTQPATAYMDEDFSDEEFADTGPQKKRAYYAPQMQMQMQQHNVALVPQKKTKIVKTKRLIERKKSVYEIFPSFTPNRPLDFVNLFGQRAKKTPRIWTRDVPPIRKSLVIKLALVLSYYQRRYFCHRNATTKEALCVPWLLRLRRKRKRSECKRSSQRPAWMLIWQRQLR